MKAIDTQSLQHPNDRINGRVLLSVNGAHFVPHFSRTFGDDFPAIKETWRAWRILLKRRFGSNYEPCALKNYTEGRQI